MKKLSLIGLLLALAVVALATPAVPAHAANACLEACTDVFLICDHECYVVWNPTTQHPQFLACQATCRQEYRQCRQGCG
jgi:hypothetical protein